MCRNCSKRRLRRIESLPGHKADGSAQSGYALIALVVLMGFLAVLLTGAVLTEGSMRAINIKMAQARKALDVARGALEEMLAALELNGYDVEAVQPITKESPSGEWVASASCQKTEDGAILVTATGSVRKVNKKITVKLTPSVSLFNTVMACQGQLSHSAPGKSRMEIYGNIYCSQHDIPGKYFPDPSFGAITELPPGLVPDIGPEPFDARLDDIEFASFPPGQINTTVTWQNDTAVQDDLTIGKKATLIVPAGVFGFVNGDLYNNGSLVVNGTLYVRGSLIESHSNATVGGTGLVVVFGSLQASLSTGSWDGLRFFAVGGESSIVRVGISDESEIRKKLFIYSSGNIELEVKKSLTLDPALFISRGYLTVDLGTGNTVLELHPGEFGWEGFDLPLHFGATYSVTDWTEEFGK